MAYHDWKVGDQVVCVNDDWTILISGEGWELPIRQPMLGEILTITRLDAGLGELGTGREDGVFLEFAEIECRQTSGGFSAELRWNAAFFRKLQKRDTDIGVFTAMLNSQKQGVDA